VVEPGGERHGDTSFVGTTFDLIEQYSREMPPAVKRPYDASRRRAQAEQTRRHIVDTATPLFVEHGYDTTSMRQLADAAGVSLQTLYNAFSSKFGVFSAVMDVVIAGDHEPLTMAERPAARQLHTIDDPRALVRAAVAGAVPVLARLARIFPVLRAAAVSDPQVAEGYQRYTIEGRYEAVRALGDRLEALEALPAGTDATRAADIAWTVLSPDAFDLLVGHRGWTTDEYATWATATLLAALVPRRRR
jgi:AcrR family transcriptional regulator